MQTMRGAPVGTACRSGADAPSLTQSGATALSAEQSEEIGRTSSPRFLAPPEQSVARAAECTFGRASPKTQCATTLPLIEIKTIGAFVVRHDGALVTQWRSQKARELLAYLATRDEGHATRRDVQAALWPDEDLTDTAHLLRTALWCLRTLLDRPRDTHTSPTDCERRANDLLSQPVTPLIAIDCTKTSIILGDRRCLVLNPARARSDLAEIRAEYRKATEQQSKPAVHDANVHGSLDAASLTAPASDTSRRDNDARARRCLQIAITLAQPVLVEETFPWLAAVRRALRQQCLEAFDQARTCAEVAGDTQLALQALEHRLQLDVTHEPSIAAVMRLSLTQSAPAQAVTYYRAYRAALIWRYGVSEATLTLPSVEVQRLFSSAVSAVENAATPASSGVERSLPTSSGDRVTGRTADAQAPPTTLSR